MSVLIDNYLAAHRQWCNADMAVYEFVQKVLGEDCCEDTCIDPADWDGTSIELTGAIDGLVPNAEQLQRFWDAGFTVVRIDYKNRTTESISGDWWQVKGLPPRHCHHQQTERVR